MKDSKIINRFLEYVKIDTQSNEEVLESPSSEGQMKLLHYLQEELISFGVRNIDMDEKGGILYAKIPSNTEKDDIKSIGFIAHVDTAPDASGKNVKPRIIENYNGKDIKLNESVTLKVSEFPEVLEYKNKSLIVTNGTTLLGADDKAGIAEIMSMVEVIMQNPEISHGEICIAFTSDEEISRGTQNFDIERFGAEVAYTVDGEKLGEISYENFNAVRAEVMVKGKSVHTGYAKNKMLNASDIACEFHEQVPIQEKAQTTEGYEGFYHLVSLKANVEKAELIYNLRDFEKANMKERMKKLEDIVEELNQKYGKNTVTIEFNEQYENMKEYLKKDKELIINAQKAGERVGVESFIQPVRGGTDGARLTVKGLPCPNLGAGGRNFHGVYEFVCIEDMEKIAKILVELVKIQLN
jgi:tripeptide aminopeptidase